MKRNDLFVVILKFYGVYLFMTAFGQLAVMLFTIIGQISRLRYSEFSYFDFLFPYFVGFGVTTGIASLFVFGSKYIVARVFRNDADIELTWRVSKKTLLQISMIVLGGMFLLYNLADVGSHILYLWQNVSNDFEPRPGDVPELIWELIMMIVGYAIITASPKVAQFLSGKIPDEEDKFTKGGIQKVIPKQRKRSKPKVVRPRATPESH